VLYGVMNEAPTVFLTNTFGFSLVAISFALLTCAALSPSLPAEPRAHSPARPAWRCGRTRSTWCTSRCSWRCGRSWNERGIDPAAPLTIVAVMAAGVFGGWLLYRLVETPFMRLRARWYPAVAPKAFCPASAQPAVSI
jgi:hypothetical protein